MIALKADRIVAGKYSLVGSIGAIMAPWELDRAIAKFDVSQRVYASGRLKAFLNPFTPVTPEVDAKARKLVSQIGKTFMMDLNTARGALLKSGVDYGTGEVWGGLEAKQLGLVDSVGTLDQVVANSWGLKTYDFGPSRDSLSILSSTLAVAISSAVNDFFSRHSLQLH